MQLNQSTDYAIRIILYLAKAARIVPSSKLAVAIGISPRYLLQIGAKLRDANLITVSYGTTGGYVLAKPPKEISLFEIISLMEGKTHMKIRPNSINEAVEFQNLKAAYEYVNDLITTALRSVTIESLLN